MVGLIDLPAASSFAAFCNWGTRTVDLRSGESEAAPVTRERMTRNKARLVLVEGNI